MNESDARTMMIDSLDLLLDKMTADAAKLRANDFSDDDTDYFPARASIASTLIIHLTHIPHESTALDALAEMISSEYFLDDLTTCDYDIPLAEYFADEIDTYIES